MSQIFIRGSIGKGEADYSTEGTPGAVYTYFPLPDTGYEYAYAEFNGQKITSYPVKAVFQIADKALQVYYQVIQPPEKPKPPEEGEEIVQSVGASCGIYRVSLMGGRFFYLKHNTKGALTSYDSELSDIQDRIKDHPECNIPIKTEETKIKELSAKIDSGLKDLQSTIKNAADVINTKLSEVKNGLETMINGIATTLSSRIAQTEVEISGINKSLFSIGEFIGNIDMWLFLKMLSFRTMIVDWVIDQAVEIVEKALDKEVK